MRRLRLAPRAEGGSAMSLAERRLLERLRERDEEAFSEIVAQHGDRVFGLILRMVGNAAEAEDLAQEVFVTVFKSIESFRGESRFSTWLLRIAANHAKNRIKYLSRRGTATEDVGELSSEVADGLQERSLQARVHRPDTLMEAAELGALLERAITELDEEQRLLIVLRDVEELSYEEICEITGLPEGTVKSRMHRARMLLKDRVAQSTR